MEEKLREPFGPSCRNRATRPLIPEPGRAAVETWDHHLVLSARSEKGGRLALQLFETVADAITGIINPTLVK